MQRALLAAVLTLVCAACAGQNLIRTLHSPDEANTTLSASMFGTTVRISDEYLVTLGAASILYVFDSDGTYLRSIQRTESPLAYAIAASRLAVGNGADVELYDLSTGDLLTTIARPMDDDGSFGAALISMNGNILIGSPQGGSGSANDAGAVYQYNVAAGTLSVWSRPPVFAGLAEYGRTLVLAGRSALVGANIPDPLNGTDAAQQIFILCSARGKAGAVVRRPLMSRISWTQGDNIASDGKQVFVGFGYNYHLYAGDQAVRPGGLWQLTRAGKPKGYTTNDQEFDTSLGAALALWHKQLYVGAPQRSGNGQVPVYDIKHLTQVQTLQNPYPENVADFGKSVESSASRLVISAADINTSAGVVYLYD